MGDGGLRIAMSAMDLFSLYWKFCIVSIIDGKVTEPMHKDVSCEDDSVEDVSKVRAEADKYFLTFLT